MKICPVCHASAFDDASICYGCLHDFSNDPQEAVIPVNAPPEFRIRFTPTQEHSGVFTWKCFVEA